MASNPVPVTFPAPVTIPPPVPVTIPAPVTIPLPSSVPVIPTFIADFYTGISQNGTRYGVIIPGTITFTNGIYTSQVPTYSAQHPSGFLPKFNINTIHSIYVAPGYTLTINGTARGKPINTITIGPGNLVKQNFTGFTGTVIISQNPTRLQQTTSYNPWLIILIIIIILILLYFGLRK